MITKDQVTIYFLALIVGLIYVFPHFVYLSSEGYYNPLNSLIGGPDEHLYAAGVQEVLEGHIIPTDLTVKEHKNNIYVYGPIPFITMAAIAQVVGGVRNAVIFSDFLFSAVIFVVFYFLSNIFLRNKYFSIICSLTMMFFYRIFIAPTPDSIGTITQHFAKHIFNYNGEPVFLWFSRFVNPPIPTVILFASILGMYHALKTKRWYSSLLAGFILSLNFYSYFYSWTYIALFEGVLFTWFAIHREWSEVKVVGKSGIVALIFGLPYLFNFMHAQSSDLALRSGVESGYFVEPISIIYLIFFIIFLVVEKQRNLESTMIGALLLANVFILNIQLVFGFTVQNSHWNSRIIVPIIILFLFYCFKNISEMVPTLSQKVLKPQLAIIIIVGLFLLAINLQIREAYALKDKYTVSAQEQELLKWISHETAQEEVILTNDLSWNLLIPAYSSANVYFPYGAATLASDEEIEQRFIIAFKILNISNEEVTRMLKANSKYVRDFDQQQENNTSFDSFLRSYIFVDSIYPIVRTGITKRHSYDPTKVERLAQEYAKTNISAQDVERYQVDYVLLIGKQRLLIDSPMFKTLVNGTISFENDAFTILKLQRFSPEPDQA